MKTILVHIFLLLFVTTKAMAYDDSAVRKSITTRLNAGDTHKLAEEAMGNLIEFAAQKLESRNREGDAFQLRDEWANHYSGVVLGAVSDVGDHEPLSAWISLWYAAMSGEFGDKFMEQSHLKDLWIMNAVLPVVFKPHASEDWCAEQLHKYPADTCEAEYRRHFAGTKYFDNDPYASDQYTHFGFAGVVTYWVTWGACEAATWGGGYIIVCTPVASIAEIAVTALVAGPASDKVWESFNP